MLILSVTLLLHYLGYGILVATTLAGMVLNLRYRKERDIPARAAVLRSLRPIGLLNPLGILIMLGTGIANMYLYGYGVLTSGWLTAKIIIFGFAAVMGISAGITSRKRAKLIETMAGNRAPDNAETLLASYDRSIGRFYLLMPLFLLLMLALSVYGRYGDY